MSYATATHPTAVVAGIGQICFTREMLLTVTLISETLKTYVGCEGPGDNDFAAEIGSKYGTLDQSVAAFKDAVSTNPGYSSNYINCIGFSQGALICRGYLQKYNGAPKRVQTFLSVHGPLTGSSSFPECG